MVHSYDVGTRAWQPDQTEGWVASEVKSKKINGDKVVLVFALENGEVGLKTVSKVDSIAETFTRTDEDDRDDRGRASVRLGQPSTVNEPGNAGGERRLDKSFASK